MSDYLKHMKEMFDSLAAAGNKFPKEDLISRVLAGLDSEYLPITTLLQDKVSLSWKELHASLLSYETKTQRLNTLSTNFSKNMNVSPTANMVFDKSSQRSHDQQGASPGRGANTFRGGANGNRGGHDRGRGQSNNRLICQICGKSGHTAAVCFYRSNLQYMGHTPSFLTTQKFPHSQYNGQSQFRPLRTIKHCLPLQIKLSMAHLNME
ncbi:hypothetical protein Scep_021208 [Stephania cephalantha]|uniref:CCHC-type domain-containing protein n=1 Tax=Stephania cephalantha TaxID=152367 RepID=A0AAP0FCX1_9MAGN